jgi:hypothetical protein
VLPVLNALLQLQPRAPAAPWPHALREALTQVAPLVHPGSLILAISDFADESSTDEIEWSRLAAHAECRLFWITDRLEERGLPDGRFRGGLPGRLVPLDGAASRSKWQGHWQERRGRVQSLATSLRLPLTRLDTADPVERQLQGALHGAPAAA